jgi:F420-0:gamma-glutamyl ligase
VPVVIKPQVRAVIHDIDNDCGSSHGRAWCNGNAGVAIDAAGMPALLDLRGRPYRHGRDSA